MKKTFAKTLIMVLAIVLVASCILCLAACGNNNNNNDLFNKTETLYIGVTDYAPLDYEEGGKWTGFDAELARLICGDLGYDVEFVEIDWNNKIVELQTKKVDMLWNGMTVTEELGQNMLFSYSYMTNKQVAVTKTENLEKYATAADAMRENATIAVESGSVGEDAAREKFTDVVTDKTNEIVGVEGQNRALTEVNVGTSDIAIVDFSLANNQCGKGSFADLAIIPGIQFEAEEFAIGFRKSDSKLRDQVNELLVKYYKDGTMEALRQQFGPDSIALIDISFND